MSDAKNLGKEFAPILDDAKKAGMSALKDGVALSRKTLSTILTGFGKALKADDKAAVLKLYQEAEDHAVAGRVGVAVSMAARLDNFLNSKALVGESQSIRAGRNFLKGLLGILAGTAKTFLGLLGGPVIAKVTELGVDAVEKMLGMAPPPAKQPEKAPEAPPAPPVTPPVEEPPAAPVVEESADPTTPPEPETGEPDTGER